MKRLIPLILALLVSSTCSADTFGGRWQGGWKSCKTSHRGRLSARFCRIDDQHVQATFRGTFALVIPFRYRATLDVVHEEPGLVQLSGAKRLGPLMGTFSYDATITNNDFQATYRSRRDNGMWWMSR
jgi:hypothetical protein